LESDRPFLHTHPDQHYVAHEDSGAETQLGDWWCKLSSTQVQHAEEGSEQWIMNDGRFSKFKLVATIMTNEVKHIIQLYKNVIGDDAGFSLVCRKGPMCKAILGLTLCSLTCDTMTWSIVDGCVDVVATSLVSGRILQSVRARPEWTLYIAIKVLHEASIAASLLLGNPILLQNYKYLLSVSEDLAMMNRHINDPINDIFNLNAQIPVRKPGEDSSDSSD
jgi:hypothetical protein